MLLYFKFRFCSFLFIKNEHDYKLTKAKGTTQMRELTWFFVDLQRNSMFIQRPFFLFDLSWDFNDLN